MKNVQLPFSRRYSSFSSAYPQLPRKRDSPRPTPHTGNNGKAGILESFHIFCKFILSGEFSCPQPLSSFSTAAHVPDAQLAALGYSTPLVSGIGGG